VLCYVNLAQALGPKQPLYGLQARGLEPGEEPDARIEDMATRYLTAIRSVQRKGPYLLAGWSVGGVVAYEAAHQLARAGERVGMLALIDSWEPRASELRAPDEASEMEAVLRHLRVGGRGAALAGAAPGL